MGGGGILVSHWCSRDFITPGSSFQSLHCRGCSNRKGEPGHAAWEPSLLLFSFISFSFFLFWWGGMWQKGTIIAICCRLWGVLFSHYRLNCILHKCPSAPAPDSRLVRGQLIQLQEHFAPLLICPNYTKDALAFNPWSSLFPISVEQSLSQLFHWFNWVTWTVSSEDLHRSILPECVCPNFSLSDPHKGFQITNREWQNQDRFRTCRICLIRFRIL